MKGLTLIRHLASAFPLIALLTAFAVFAPSSALAEESPQYGHFAFKVGGYYPEIDKEFKSATPFKDYFGTSNLWLLELELGVNIWSGVGRVGIAAHGGWASAEADAKTRGNSGPSPSKPPSSPTKGGDKNSVLATDQTSFTVYPLALTLFYSFDYLAVEYNIPLALNLDAGIVYAPWTIDGTNGEVAVYDGKKGRGGTWGWRGSVALAFYLNVLDKNTAALFDMSWGVNASYLFAEFVYQKVDDFGSKKSLNLSDQYFLFGLEVAF